MSLTEITVEGTFKPDGTLELDRKPNFPPGRVQVVLRQESAIDLPGDDPFWLRMRAILAIPRSRSHAADGGANTLEEVLRARDEWDEHQRALEGIQEGSNP